MNANELAEALEKLSHGDIFDFVADSSMSEAATMLRQQHAEIETLKFHGYRTQYELLRIKCIEQQAEIETLKLKKLTDEEIADIRDEFLSPSGCDIYTFARAILKKAQENNVPK